MSYPVIIFFVIVLIILTLLLLVIIVVVLTTLKITIKYIRKGEDDNISVVFSTLKNFLKLEYEIPMTDTWRTENRRVKIYRIYRRKARKELVDVGKLIDRYTSIRESEKITNTFVSKADDYLISKGRLKIEVLKLLIIVGLKDAFWTGIITGIIWSFLGNVYSFFANNYRILEKSLIVKPNYLQEMFDVDFLCIISLKNVHIITVGLIYIISRIQDRIYNRRWFKWHSTQ
jgi:hypothetical protein